MSWIQRRNHTHTHTLSLSSIADMEVGQIWEQLKNSMEDLRTAASCAVVQAHAHHLSALDASTLRGKERKKYQVEKAIKLGAHVCADVDRPPPIIVNNTCAICPPPLCVASPKAAASKGHSYWDGPKGQGAEEAGGGAGKFPSGCPMDWRQTFACGRLERWTWCWPRERLGRLQGGRDPRGPEIANKCMACNCSDPAHLSMPFTARHSNMNRSCVSNRNVRLC